MNALQTISEDIDDSIWTALRLELGNETVKTLQRSCLAGIDYKVPVRISSLHPDHQLVRAIGQEEAERMVQRFAGEQFYIRQGCPTQDDRDRRILAAVQEGLTNQEIAQRMGFSLRHTRHLLRQLGIPPRPQKNHHRKTSILALPAE